MSFVQGPSALATSPNRVHRLFWPYEGGPRSSVTTDPEVVFRHVRELRTPRSVRPIGCATKTQRPSHRRPCTWCSICSTVTGEICERGPSRAIAGAPDQTKLGILKEDLDGAVPAPA